MLASMEIQKQIRVLRSIRIMGDQFSVVVEIKKLESRLKADTQRQIPRWMNLTKVLIPTHQMLLMLVKQPSLVK